MNCNDEVASERLVDLKESFPLFRGLRPAVDQCLQAGVRFDRRLVQIQIIEALRLHAAMSDRKFPATLADLNVLPIPDDPMTGKPVTYRLDGETAVLEFPLQDIPSYGGIIRITLRKAN